MSTSLQPSEPVPDERPPTLRYERRTGRGLQRPPPLPLAVRRPVPSRSAALAPVVGAVGLAIIAGSFAMERTATAAGDADPVFWLGFVVLVAPIVWRLLAVDAPRGRRLALTGLFGVLSYAVKVLRDPLTVVMSDEFTHLSVAQQMARTHSLFPPVAISGGHVAADYPGLHIAAVTVADVTGLSLFVSALIIIAVAKLIVMLALFHLFEHVSGSARMAGLGTALFAANSNFLFWSAQFSYESLALPLFIVALYLFIARTHAGRHRRSYAISIALLTLTVAATHHVTTYALALTFWTLTLMAARRGSGGVRAVGLASFATVLSLLWFFLVAPSTAGYLGFIVDEAVSAVRHIIGAGVHAPFQSSAASLQTPAAEEGVAFLGVAFVGIGVLVTLLRRRRFPALGSDLGILLAVAGVGCLALYPLRALPGAWETANRAQEFLFIGVAFVLGLAVTQVRVGSGRRRAAVMLAMLVVIAGGVIEGWPAPLRLSQPLFVTDGSRTITPQGFATARWAAAHLPRPSVFVGDEATARELAVDGAHFAYFGDIGSPWAQLLQSGAFPAWQRSLLRENRVDYLVVDDRRIADNDQAAYFFSPQDDPSGGAGYFPARARQKFAALAGVSRVSDSGDIVVFDVASLHRPPPACAQVGTPSIIDGLTCATPTGTLTAPTASGVVTLAGARIRDLGAFAQRLTGGLWVTITLQVENLGAAPIRALAAPRATELLAGDLAFLPQPTVPFHTANLARAGSVAVGSSVVGTLTFELTAPSSIRVALAGRAGLSLPSPGGEHGQVAWIPLGKPRLIR
ncbi:MAG: hypothetical protein ABSH51_24040 [Solirubrobacteraceae bacterium]|jgi:hypothetical protein